MEIAAVLVVIAVLFIAMGLTVINPWHAMSLPN